VRSKAFRDTRRYTIKPTFKLYAKSWRSEYCEYSGDRAVIAETYGVFVGGAQPTAGSNINTTKLIINGNMQLPK
jgi:hypothetical protein